MVRSLAYLIVYIAASHISGAHFNPAVSLACYISDKISGKHNDYSKEPQPNQSSNKRNYFMELLITIFIQVVGSYLGIFITFLLAKDYVNSYFLFPNENIVLYVYSDIFSKTEGF